MLHGRLLNYLDEVARAGSIRKAAERLNVSPTAVNRQILQLEEMLDVQLFQRLPRGMKLTAAGEALLSHVRQTLRDYRALESRLEDMREMRGGEVRLVTMNGLASGLVAAAVRDFAARFARVRIECGVTFISGIIRAVIEGEADLGLGYNLPDDPQLAVLDRYDAPLGAVVAPDHPLARAEKLRPGDCAGYPLVLADETMVMHRTIRDALLRANLSFRPQFQSNSIDFMREIAAAGEAIAFLSAFDVAMDVAEGRLIHVPLLDPAMRPNVLMLVTRRARVQERPTLQFVETLRGYLAE
ncbi:LysR family transcriptional regulator [Haematobacter massiliensis]|uniref:LysR family transcriptional regulator n=1 Tax=Haematobacter massiliensis TaxID=195105 RepID=A0A086Y4V4_9RHOB|nr:LysR family transcriptional regulator [Haematobacter massiliensis]KFI29304.1 LysR family transcriptional regulator [Haematobacter massiliensis]OWJ69888.1 LysR family transcriptional regulator [Haematobacter massiliensis]OWJ82690.1 LysR family transcriptional regulator [Haematobacter massiliensis]QBJ25920.1 LysR family transcriptional regulator [Haematobacter massiliensis]